MDQLLKEQVKRCEISALDCYVECTLTFKVEVKRAAFAVEVMLFQVEQVEHFSKLLHPILSESVKHVVVVLADHRVENSVQLFVIKNHVAFPDSPIDEVLPNVVIYLVVELDEWMFGELGPIWCHHVILHYLDCKRLSIVPFRMLFVD